ncbi:MAG: hypothetical protein P8I91_01255 [Phycisphaerales bacterium]|nr:hypothetical protein [Phycisphaerales bacterium]
MQPFAIIAPMLTAVLLSASCASHSSGGLKQTATTEDGRYRVTWQKTPPSAIEANQYFELLVEVEDLKTAEDPQDFRFDATMPAHRHGMNTIVNAVRSEDNHWVIQDLNLHMPGEWVMTFDVFDANGVLHRASEVVILK